MIFQQKLWKLTFNLKNSPTILLPVWYKTLAAHQLSPCMMPHDVSTCWNSTFNMLEFAVKYRAAIDTMTRAHDFGLHQYKLVPAEWKITSELRHVLKVRFLLLQTYVYHVFHTTFRFSKMQLYTFLEVPQILRW